MFSESIFLCLLFSTINVISTQDNQSCEVLQRKLNKYQTYINPTIDPETTGLRVCQNFINNTCCPQLYADRIQNATLMELYQLLELQSMNFYQPLMELNDRLNGKQLV